jgi:hypothetical protein
MPDYQRASTVETMAKSLQNITKLVQSNVTEQQFQIQFLASSTGVVAQLRSCARVALLWREGLALHGNHLYLA